MVPRLASSTFQVFWSLEEQLFKKFLINSSTLKSKTMFKSLLAIIARYGVLIREWSDLYYALLEVSMNKIELW